VELHRIGADGPPPDYLGRAADALAPGGVHVWVLPTSPERATAVGGWLTPDEAARAGERRRARFTAARGTLRELLAAYTGLAPREVPIAYGPHGKPHLVPELGSPIAFNVSHSGDLAAIAVASHREVGVDVELRRPRKRLALLADAVLAPSERDWYAGLPERARLAGFLDAWSAKESFSKLIGRGLTFPFRAISLAAPGAAVSAVAIDERHGARPPCTVARLDLDPAYSGALALETGTGAPV
jgi:4'-phosphopantetheinyl transferase